MTLRPSIIFFVLLTLCVGCGSGPVVIDVDLPVGQVSPFEELVDAPAGSIFFQFDPLVSTATSVDQITGTGSITFPSDIGFQPNNESYDISQAPLDNNTPYRVTMFGAVDGVISGAAKYRGVADCPLIKSLGDNNILNICFGLASQIPICVDQTPFGNCPN